MQLNETKAIEKVGKIQDLQLKVLVRFNFFLHSLMAQRGLLDEAFFFRRAADPDDVAAAVARVFAINVGRFADV